MALSLGWSNDECTNNSAAATLMACFSGLTRLQWGMGKFLNNLFKRRDAVIMGHITNAMLEQLGQLTGLQELQLGGTAVPYSEADMEFEWEGMFGRCMLPLPPDTMSLLPLAALAGLTQLQLGSEDQCLHWIDGYHAAHSALTALEVLGVHTLSWNPHRELPKAVAPLHKLRKLTLEAHSEDSSYETSWAVHFARLTGLQELDLHGCNLDDGTVRVLAIWSACTCLECLHLSNMEFTDAVAHCVLPQLRMLEAWCCREAGVPLRQLMPALVVLKATWSHGQLVSVHGHPNLVVAELGGERTPSSALAKCLATLPRLQQRLG